jgi:hypothetical protein
MEHREALRGDVPPSHARPRSSNHLDPGVPDRLDRRCVLTTATGAVTVREARKRAKVSTASRRGDVETVLVLRRRVGGGASAWRRALAFLLLRDHDVAEVCHGGPTR